MLFSSSIFLFVFLPIVLVLYYNPFFKSIYFRNGLLLLASLGFYAYGEPRFVFIMLASIIMNYIFGLLLDKHKNKLIFILSIILNLSILFIYKYLGFTLGIINDLTALKLNIPNIVLPIGISFFTFQAMSYVIDVYRGKVAVQRNIFSLALYISFFPQLIAGPIVRYIDIEKEINHRQTSREEFNEGVVRFIYGLGKKVFLANSLAMLADIAFNMEISVLSTMMAWLGAIAYMLQIYFDFSGYSDMAIGLGKMFGFHFLENFNYPYIASSITDFWRRWHISLSNWFRDYVYIPLGGNRVSKQRMYFNISVVWLLTGLWHGASWNFILWGLWYLLFLILEKATSFTKKLGILGHLYTLLVVLVGWVLFRSNDVSSAFKYLSVMFGNSIFIDGRFILYLKNFGFFIIVGIICSLGINNYLEKKANNNKFIALVLDLTVILILIISITYLVKGTYNPFIYFNF